MVSAMYAPHQTKGTYSLVPGIPELRDTKVETDAERERTGEDRRDENTYWQERSTQPYCDASPPADLLLRFTKAL